MKTGILYKENDKWWVKYEGQGNVSSSGTEMIASFWLKLPLHPDDVAVFNELEERFDNFPARVSAAPDINFEEVEILPPNGNYMEPLYYAKLVKNENDEK